MDFHIIPSATPTHTISNRALTIYRTRPGERVAKRRRAKAPIGVNHKITTNETIKWFKNRFDGIVR